MKICRNKSCACGDELQPLENFDANKNGRQGRQSQCKACLKAAWEKLTPTYIREKARKPLPLAKLETMLAAMANEESKLFEPDEMLSKIRVAENHSKNANFAPSYLESCKDTLVKLTEVYEATYGNDR